MPGVPLGPQHLLHNALHPPDKEFVPPAAVADEYTAAEEQLSLLMACNYPQFVKQLGLFVWTAAVLNAFEPHKQLVAPITEIFEMFTKFTNKFRQFWGPHGAKTPPPAITATLELGEEFHKLRVRAKANQNSLLEAACDKSRAEKDDAKKEAKKSKRKKQVLSAEAVQSDPEDSVIVVDEDTVMDDLLDAQGDDDLDSIDADAFMAEIDDAKKEKEKASTSKSAQKLPKISKNKPRAETVCIPYTRVGCLDRSSSAFVKAMNIIGKTDPKERTADSRRFVWETHCADAFSLGPSQGEQDKGKEDLEKAKCDAQDRSFSALFAYTSPHAVGTRCKHTGDPISVPAATIVLASDTPEDELLRKWWTNVGGCVQGNVLLDVGYVMEPASSMRACKLRDTVRNTTVISPQWLMLPQSMFQRHGRGSAQPGSWPGFRALQILFNGDGHLHFKMKLWEDVRGIMQLMLVCSIPRVQYTNTSFDRSVVFSCCTTPGKGDRTSSSAERKNWK
ncbi:hypothetical protein B0H13DRAFT_2394459 [Mycena leptocephala]|nr:hypothetical protein B0H13DRAFT_2394459 [Mycena leptocephala]